MLERTRNMLLMSVTLDVSQLEMSALKRVKLKHSPFMLEIDETSQLAMAPYVVIAYETFESNAWTALIREAVLVKIPGGCGGGEGGDGGKGGEDGEGGGDEGGSSGDGDGCGGGGGCGGDGGWN